MTTNASDLVEECRARLAKAPGAHGDPFRTPVLATFHPALGAQARVVVLRGCDARASLFDVHSDARADKVRALLADPRATLLFWDPERRLQVRIEARAEVFDGGSPQGRAVLDTLGGAAREAYRHQPDPGQAIASHDAYAAGAEPGRDPAERFFRLIRLRVERLDALSLEREAQARARQERGAGAEWIVP